MQDLRALDADILCLQEVDHFEDFFEPLLQKLGYDSKYKKKDGKFDGCAIFWKRKKLESLFLSLSSVLNCTRRNQQKTKKKKKRFTLVKYEAIEFNENTFDSQEYQEEIRRDNVAQFISLRLNQGDHPSEDLGVTLSNCHLFWNPLYAFVRLHQIHTLKRRLSLFNQCVTLERREGSLPYPMLALGDFNITPDNIMFKVLTDPAFVYDHEEEIEDIVERFSSLEKEMQGSKIVEQRLQKPFSIVSFLTPPEHGDPNVANLQRMQLQACLFQSREHMQRRLKQTMHMILESRRGQIPKFHSCYGDYSQIVDDEEKEEIENEKVLGPRAWKGEPRFTTFTESFRSVLDYIFQAKEEEAVGGAADSIELLRRRILHIPLASELAKDTGIPSDLYPSDHVPIGVEFQFWIHSSSSYS